jgi:tellurite methyltransferase
MRNLNWKKYQKLVVHKPPSPLLREALSFVDGGRALDLGGGALQDSQYLLEKGFIVLAVDFVKPSKLPKNKHFAFLKARFSKAFPAIDQYNLINAQFSLPFNGKSKAEFKKLWANINDSLVPGGVFTGQLFGNYDDWAKNKYYGDVVFHSRKEVKQLLKGLEVLHFAEVERVGRVVGESKLKHWHFFNIIARKK